MERRPLGNSGIDVSPIGLGCWAMGGDRWWGPADDNESIGCIHEALDLGINLIDTAAAYGTGHAEEVLGKALMGRREDAVIATKCGLVANPYLPEGVDRCLTPESIAAECEQSLRRLRTEYIDLYQCHWPDPDTPIDETMEAMNRLKEQGKIRAIGVSNFGTAELSVARKTADVASLQPPFSMIRREAAEALIPYCQEYRIAVLAYSPLHHGLLSGKLTADMKFSDLRRDDPEFRGERYRRNLDRVTRLTEMAAARGKSMVALAVNWVINAPGVTAALVGAKRASHIRGATDALGWLPTDDESGRIQAVLEN